MLSAGTTASVGINTDVLIIDFYVQIFLNIRHYIAGYERGLTLSSCVERGNTDQTVNSFLRLQKSVCVLSVYLESNGFHTSFISIQIVQYFDGKALALSPACVHTVQHAAPVAGFCSAGSCIQLNDGILAVILSGEKSLHADAVKLSLELG